MWKYFNLNSSLLACSLGVILWIYSFFAKYFLATVSVDFSSSKNTFSNSWVNATVNLLIYFILERKEAVVRSCSVKKVFLEISQNSKESTCARVSFLIKRLWLWDFIKKETLTQVFSCNFVKFLRTPFLTEHLRWLLLNVRASSIGTYAKFPQKPRFS